MSLGSIFMAIFNFFERRRVILFLSLAMIVALLAWMASGTRFTEDPAGFFPKSGEGKRSARLFGQLKAKDKIVIMFEADSSLSDTAPDILISASDEFSAGLYELAGDYIESSKLLAGENEQEEAKSFVYDNLPIFLEEEDYQRIEQAVQEEGISSSLASGLALLLSPAGEGARGYFESDPLSIGTPLMARYDSLRMGMDFTLYRNHLFSSDLSALLYVVSPVYSSGDSRNNEVLVSALEKLEAEIEHKYQGINISFSGGPCVGVYNSRVIKSDTLITSSIALLLILLLFWFAFRDIRTLLLLVLPALFGALFALAIMAAGGGEVSSIAVGAGATVMGIALSYSIHVITHHRHVGSISQLLDEISYPLTVGGFTTIGAFIGLQFTNSTLLRDFGLFSALTLAGTTIFSLIYLPHMLPAKANDSQGKLGDLIEKITSFEYEKRSWLKWGIVLLFVMGLFLAPGVKFESDMTKLGYEPESHKEAQRAISEKFGMADSRVFLLSASGEMESAAAEYHSGNEVLERLSKEGSVEKSASLSWMLPPAALQKERIERWNSFWSNGKREKTIETVNNTAARMGFSPDAFSRFETILAKEYAPLDFTMGRNLLPSSFREWAEETDSTVMLITQLFVSENNKPHVYKVLESETSYEIIDRAHFSGMWAEGIRDDFNTILLISSLLVFLTLLISYGRIELALMAFLPMMVSWVIILGLMSLLGIPFNIFNILLATFIFGIGDDFSIFVLDGLSGEYMGKKNILTSHKAAIFFSAFTVLAGMGSMIFAVHPALKSIAMVSLLGMFAVWIVAYTVQPVIYRLFITSQASKGLPPYTFSGVLQMLVTFSAFVTGCFIAALMIPFLMLFPVSHDRRVLLFRKFIRAVVFIPVRLSPTVRIFFDNSHREDFSRPAVIIANHQSFIDILMLLSLHPKIIMMTNKWVWNSPFFGHVVRFAGFLYHKDGIENHIAEIARMREKGYSLLIFPEGTRTPDMDVHRFHKGAFRIAEELEMDILPVVIYGNGNLVSKRQPFYVKHGVIGCRILKRIEHRDKSYGSEYRSRTKSTVALFRREYAALRREYDSPSNRFFYHAVLANYLYKGPVLEWYMRIKMNMERSYEQFHSIIPHNATVTDIGCGYGPLVFMLALLSPSRKVTGIDYDEKKIELAASSYAAGENISFRCEDVLSAGFEPSDVFIMNDILHYLMPGEQELLIKKAVSGLKSGGFLIVRDGDAESVQNHRMTRLSEWFSINLLGFNKADHAPCFIGKGKMAEIARSLGCSIEMRKNDKVTSNTVYIIKPEETNGKV